MCGLEEREKVVLLEADLTKVDFGLGERELGEVRSFVFSFCYVQVNEYGVQLKGVTHIIHNAWPVNFNLHLSSFEPHVKGLCHLVRLALLNAGTIRIMFTSSIAVASHYSPPSSSTFPSSSSSSSEAEIPIVKVPEIPLDATHPAPFGYAQAKWVSEQILESVNQLFGSAVRASIVRLGQITGTIDKGAWNEWEHIPLIVRTLQSLGVVPDLRGVSRLFFPYTRLMDGFCVVDSLMAPRRQRKRHPHRPLVLAILQTDLSPREPNTTPLAPRNPHPRLSPGPRRYRHSPLPDTIPTMDGLRSEKRASPASYPDHAVPRRGIWEVGGWVGWVLYGWDGEGFSGV